MTLAAITVELARAVGDGGASTLDSPVDVFSLSRMFEVAGSREQSVEACQRALSGGLPEEIEARALHQLALQYKRQRLHDLAVVKWLELSRRASLLGLEAFEELAIHYEHRLRDPKTAIEFTLAALELLEGRSAPVGRPGQAQDLPLQTDAARFTHRLQRLQRKLAKAQSTIHLPIA